MQQQEEQYTEEQHQPLRQQTLHQWTYAAGRLLPADVLDWPTPDEEQLCSFLEGEYGFEGIGSIGAQTSIFHLEVFTRECLREENIPYEYLVALVHNSRIEVILYADFPDFLEWMRVHSPLMLAIFPGMNCRAPLIF
jgi:hypothetical protein